MHINIDILHIFICKIWESVALQDKMRGKPKKFHILSFCVSVCT